MIFTVKNLGPIKEASVDLSKDLIVLTGQNNTGKTYLANVLYGLYQKELITQGTFMPSWPEGNTSQSINLKHIIENTQFIHKSIEEGFSANIKSIFNTDSVFFRDTVIEININNSNFLLERAKALEVEDAIKGRFFGVSGVLNFKKKQGDYNIVFELEGDESVENSTLPAILFQRVIEIIINEVCFPNTPFFIPAERQGIVLFQKELGWIKKTAFDDIVQGKVQNGRLKEIQETFNQYAFPIKQTLNIIQGLDSFYGKEESKYAYLSKELEKSFTIGEIAISDKGSFLYKPQHSEKYHEVHLASSTIKSLSILSVYLRYLAKENDCIIIDEPELNLHPDNQRKVARFLGRLVNEGFKVIVSTHSDYIIKEFNNMIMLSSAVEKQPELLEKYGYEANQLIKHEQIEAHLFTIKNPSPEKIKIDETGFSVRTIDDVIEEMDNAAEDIYFNLFENQPEANDIAN